MPHPYVMRRSWIAVATAAGVAAAVLGTVRLARHRPAAPPRPATGEVLAPPPLAQIGPVEPVRSLSEPPSRPSQDAVPGLDLLHLGADDTGVVARAEGGKAHLTLDPELQRAAVAVMAAHHVPEGAVVLMDVATGRLLVYANHLEHGPARDVCSEAKAPSASVFKIVTAAALVEDAHLDGDTKQCYSGGETRITSADLAEDPARDRWCTSLAGALGRSINTVFARLASTHLDPAQLEAMARRFGYGEAQPFDVPVQPSGLHVPSEPLEFARTAAGFWHTTLSPLAATEMSAIIARGGESVRPVVVDQVVSSTGKVVWSAGEAPPPRRAVARETAEALTTMMERTVKEGTSYRAFHDPRGASFLPGIGVAGKTGTLTDADARRFYTWFTGFAPSRAASGAAQVAVAVLVVNGPTWEVKANVIAREVLRAYFASRGVAGVTRPGLAAIARRGGR